MSLPSVWLGACSEPATTQSQSGAGMGGAGARATTSDGGRGGAVADSGAGGELIDMDGDVDQSWMYDGPAYDGDPSCTPPQTGPYDNVSCCAGEPCNGRCELHDNAWTCTCFKIDGGCGPFGQKCCTVGLGCVTACEGTVAK